MPCYEPRDLYIVDQSYDNSRLVRENQRLTAMLCALSDTVDQQTVRANWDERKAGVSYLEYRDWLHEHRKEDARRKKKRTAIERFSKWSL